MPMFRLRPLHSALVLALAVAWPTAHAIKLGEPRVLSYVGQPLKVEFAVLDSTPEEMNRLRITLGTEDIYRSMRTKMHPALKTSSLSLRMQPTPVLTLKTEGPVEDSVLDLFFELSWAAGRMIQSSIVLIDPAPADIKVHLPEMTQSLPQVIVINEQPPEISKDLQVVASYTSATSSTRQESAVDKPSQITVKRGDTLTAIASRINYDGVRLEQVLIALYEKNSSVFSSQNINLIRAGSVLTLPTLEEVQQIDAQRAVRVVALHAENFRAYVQTLAAKSPSSSIRPQQTTQTTGVVQSIVTDDTPVVSKQGDRLLLGTASGGQGGDGASKEQQLQVEKALAEAKERQRILDEQLKQLQKLIEVKNAALAHKTSISNDQAKKDVEPEQLTPSPVQNDTVLPVSNMRPMEEKPALPRDIIPSSNTGDDSTIVASSTPAPEQSFEKPKKANLEPVVPPPPVESETDIMEYAVPALGGLGIIALLGGWVWMRRKKKDLIEEDYDDNDNDDVGVLPASKSVDSINKLDDFQTPQEMSFRPDDETFVSALKRMPPIEPDKPPNIEVGSHSKKSSETKSLSVLTDISDVEVNSSPAQSSLDAFLAKEPEPIELPMESPALEVEQFAQKPHMDPTEIQDVPLWLNFEYTNSDSDQIEELTQSLSMETSALEPTLPVEDESLQPTSLTYDPDEQLGIAKFYLSLQDLRGAWDMLEPLLNHEREDIKAQAFALVENIPEAMRTQWSDKD